jgi:TfoX/Sxy family transcriptional regulator of competence genes
MPYNEQLAERVREILQVDEGIIEKKMFGGVAFMLNDRMFCGIVKDDLMVRCLDQRYNDLLENLNCRPMDFTGKPMRGFLYVSIDALVSHKQLRNWLDIGIEFAVQSPARKKKKNK